MFDSDDEEGSVSISFNKSALASALASRSAARARTGTSGYEEPYYILNLEIRGDYSDKQTVSIDMESFYKDTTITFTFNDIPVGASVYVYAEVFFIPPSYQDLSGETESQLRYFGQSSTFVVESDMNYATVTMEENYDY